MDSLDRTDKSLIGIRICLLLAFAVQLQGCASTPAFFSMLNQEETLFEEAEKRREEFLIERTEESIKWLLSNRAKNGMSKGDIDRIVGEHGERVFDDTVILSGGGLYRADDLVYSWGPDKEGNAYMLVFRDNKLVNFENFNKENALPGI